MQPSKQSNSLSVVQVGLGRWGRNWYEEVLAPAECVQVAAVVDTDADALREARQALSLREAACFTDLDRALDSSGAAAVLVTTSLAAHVASVRTALRAGRHVLVEKPFAPSIAEAEELAAEARKRNLVLMVSQNYRYFPAPRRAAGIVESGELGALGSVHIDFRRNHVLNRSRYAAHFRLADPLLVDMAIHHFDLIRMICRSEPREVYYRSYQPPWSHYRDPPAGAAVIELENAPIVSYHGNWASPGAETYWAGEWRMEFAEGEVQFTSRRTDGSNDDALSIRRLGREPRSVPLPYGKPTGRAGSLAAFAEAVSGGTEPETSAADNLHTLRVMFAAMESAREGKPVRIR